MQLKQRPDVYSGAFVLQCPWALQLNTTTWGKVLTHLFHCNSGKGHCCFCKVKGPVFVVAFSWAEHNKTCQPVDMISLKYNKRGKITLWATGAEEVVSTKDVSLGKKIQKPVTFLFHYSQMTWISFWNCFERILSKLFLVTKHLYEISSCLSMPVTVGIEVNNNIHSMCFHLWWSEASKWIIFHLCQPPTVD